METNESNFPASAASCHTTDWLCSGKSLLVWGLPILALIVGGSWSSMRSWLWIPALLIMGIACLANATRCGRVHCYFTGPLYLVAAAYVVPAEFHLVPMNPNGFLGAVLLLTLIAYLAEFPLGRYRKA
ncbi:MAG: hypothetical protein WAN10_08245 [Candidatus Acidiferrales bacterium]